MVSDQRRSELISASAVGEYVYCARAYGLRQVTAGAADPAAAAWQAQGRPGQGWSAVTGQVQQRLATREAGLRQGSTAHQAHGQGLRLSRWVLVVGLALLVLGLVVGALGPAG